VCALIFIFYTFFKFKKNGKNEKNDFRILFQPFAHSFYILLCVCTAV
jgi:hypothetical protein